MNELGCCPCIKKEHGKVKKSMESSFGLAFSLRQKSPDTGRRGAGLKAHLGETRVPGFRAVTEW